MRTTLTIDDDVAVILEQVRKSRRITFKKAVNDALRQGLREITRPPRSRKDFRTKSISLGRCLMGRIDDIAEVLALSEGENYK